MKKKYEELEMEFVELEIQDIIATSETTDAGDLGEGGNED